MYVKKNNNDNDSANIIYFTNGFYLLTQIYKEMKEKMYRLL